jgi:hypothetical protein
MAAEGGFSDDDETDMEEEEDDDDDASVRTSVSKGKSMVRITYLDQFKIKRRRRRRHVIVHILCGRMPLSPPLIFTTTF